MTSSGGVRFLFFERSVMVQRHQVEIWMKFEKTWVSKIPDLGILDNLKKPDIRNNFKKDLGILDNFKKRPWYPK